MHPVRLGAAARSPPAAAPPPSGSSQPGTPPPPARADLPGPAPVGPSPAPPPGSSPRTERAPTAAACLHAPHRFIRGAISTAHSRGRITDTQLRGALLGGGLLPGLAHGLAGAVPGGVRVAPLPVAAQVGLDLVPPAAAVLRAAAQLVAVA